MDKYIINYPVKAFKNNAKNKTIFMYVHEHVFENCSNPFNWKRTFTNVTKQH